MTQRDHLDNESDSYEATVGGRSQPKRIDSNTSRRPVYKSRKRGGPMVFNGIHRRHKKRWS